MYVSVICLNSNFIRPLNDVAFSTELHTRACIHTHTLVPRKTIYKHTCCSYDAQIYIGEHEASISALYIRIVFFCPLSFFSSVIQTHTHTHTSAFWVWFVGTESLGKDNKYRRAFRHYTR